LVEITVEKLVDWKAEL
jgi:hypothetical protein